MFCNNCGRQVPEGSNFCSSCGARLNLTEVPAVETPVVEQPSFEPATPAVDIKPAMTFDWSAVQDEPHKKAIPNVASPWGETSIKTESQPTDSDGGDYSRTMSMIDILKKQREEQELAEEEATLNMVDTDEYIEDAQEEKTPLYYVPPMFEDIEMPEAPAEKVDIRPSLDEALSAILDGANEKPVYEEEEPEGIDPFGPTAQLSGEFMDEPTENDTVESFESMLNEAETETEDTDFFDYEALISEVMDEEPEVAEPVEVEAPVEFETPAEFEAPLADEVEVEMPVEVEEPAAEVDDGKDAEIEALKKRLAELMGTMGEPEEVAEAPTIEVEPAQEEPEMVAEPVVEEKPAIKSLDDLASALTVELTENEAAPVEEVVEEVVVAAPVVEEIAEAVEPAEEVAAPVEEPAEEAVVEAEAPAEEELPLIDPTPVAEEELSLVDEQETRAEIIDDNNNEVMSVEELEKDLFGVVTEADIEAETTKKIDKFYTLYKKNEDFQKLLDEEYNKLKKEEEEVPTVSAVLEGAEEKAEEVAENVEEVKEETLEKAEEKEVTGKSGTALTIIAVVVAVLLVILLAIILVLNFAPDSGIAIKIDSIIETITSYFSVVDATGKLLL